MEKKCHNCNKTCWNCPAAIFKGNVDFRACGQSKQKIKELQKNKEIVIECSRRPELGFFEPNITFEQCPEWVQTDYGHMLKNMRVMILGIDGYLGWALALKLGKLGFKVSGIDNYLRRDGVMEKGAHSIIPLPRMTQRLKAAKDFLGVDINFRRMDLLDYDKIKEFLEEEKPEAIVHYAEIPSAPYSMVSYKHARKVQENNVLGTLGLLFAIKETVPESCLIKLGTMGEYGAPLTGRPLFEGIFPADAILKWKGREWSLGGEITPRDPVSLYHVSKVQDSFNVYEACKYWWLRSYDIMQGIIYGVHTDEVSKNPLLRTRFDIDEWFGTVINRFVSQAILGMPLTVYGSGEQIKGFIALEDAMDCMVRLILSPPEPGQYDVVNQVSGLHKLNELAEFVAKISKERFGLDVKIQKVENPRVESEEHPLEVLSTKLPNIFGFNQKVTPEIEIERMLDLLIKPEYKDMMEQKKHTLTPKTHWSGEKRDSETLEIYDPGTKIFKSHIGKLINQEEK
jgi:UDP-sulfoquinovose synthase